MLVIETTYFTRRVQELLSDDEYRQLQAVLVIRPDLGDVIKGSGGIRKVRWRSGRKGKSGGVRVIYYWVISQDRLLMLMIYPKSEQDDLSPDQLKALRKIVEDEYP